MAVTRAKSKFNDEAKRLRIGLSDLEGGRRKELWITFTLAMYMERPIVKCHCYDGPDHTASPLAAKYLAWDTRIVELANEAKGLWNKQDKVAHTMWTARFGPAQQDPANAQTLLKRRLRDTKRKSTDSSDVRKKRVKVERSSSVAEVPRQHQHQAATGPSSPVDTADPSDNFSDARLIILYLDFKKTFSESAYIRFGRHLQQHHNLASPVPSNILERLRDEAPSWTSSTPKNIWSDATWVEYLRTAQRASSPERERPNQRYGTAFKKLVAELDAWRKDTYDFFAKHFPDEEKQVKTN